MEVIHNLVTGSNEGSMLLVTLQLVDLERRSISTPSLKREGRNKAKYGLLSTLTSSDNRSLKCLSIKVEIFEDDLLFTILRRKVADKKRKYRPPRSNSPCRQLGRNASQSKSNRCIEEAISIPKV